MMDLPHQDYVVEPILPTGLYLLAGSPKIGKSWFVLKLGIAVSNGQSFLGFKTSESSVLYLCLEDTYQRIRNRLMDYEEESLDHIDFVLESQSLDYGLINDLKYHLELKPNTKLIIIDTLQKIRNNRSNESSPKSCVKWLCVSTEEKSLNPVSSLFRIINVNSTA